MASSAAARDQPIGSDVVRDPQPGLQGAFDCGGDQTVPRPQPSSLLLSQHDREYAYWERQVHALAVWLVNNRLMTVDELRRGVEGLDPRLYSDLSYYEKWAASVAAILVERGSLTRDAIDAELAAAGDGDDGVMATAKDESIRFQVGDRVRVRGEGDVRRWRRPHLRVPGYLHGAIGVVTAVLGAFDNPSYAAFNEGAESRPQPLYRVAFMAGAVWGTVAEGAGGDDGSAASSGGDCLEADIFQPWLEAAPEETTDTAAATGALPPAPYASVDATVAVDHGDHKHSSRGETECKAVAAEVADPPLRPLASALLRLLATPGRPTQAKPQPGAPASSAPLTMATIATIVEAMDDKMRAGLGAKLVARAWVDTEFKARLLADAPTAAAELGIATSNYGASRGGHDISLYPNQAGDAAADDDDEPERPNQSGNLAKQIERFSTGHTLLRVVENTPDAEHHLVVCTLCSCYPAAVLGLSPEWYKSSYFRARAVRDPRGLLRDEFGLLLGVTTRLVVHDSTAEVRYMVLPARPAGTDGWSEEELQAIISRDSLLGVAECRPDVKRAPYNPPVE